MYVHTYIPLDTTIDDVAIEKDALKKNLLSALQLIHEPPHGQNPNQEPQAVSSKQHASMHPCFMLPCIIHYAEAESDTPRCFLYALWLCLVANLCFRFSSLNMQQFDNCRT